MDLGLYELFFTYRISRICEQKNDIFRGAKMQIKSSLRINGNLIDTSYLEKDEIAGCRYAKRKWLKDLMIDAVSDNIQAIITVDGKEIASLELEAKRQKDKLVLTRAATVASYYAWCTMTQGTGKTYGISYGLNDTAQLKKAKPEEDTQLKLF